MDLEIILKQYSPDFHTVVPFNKDERLLLMDFTEDNTDLTPAIFENTQAFTQYINDKLSAAGARYGIGGYNEHRTIYERSFLFSNAPKVSPTGVPIAIGIEGAEPRRLHLGIDIWGKPLTPVKAPLDGIVNSFANNDAYGDYGATIILSHQLEGVSFYTLYGHLSSASIKNLQEGQRVKKGDVIGEFGIPAENGSWPPHLHFQIIKDMQGHKGDYPGVCAYSEREAYLANCPNPDLILNMLPYAR
jgi:murein DD-endopeptidase MepM/ murein hydrolase activator NlpD